MKDMGHAAHRMESARRPLGRSCLWFDGLVSTSTQMYAERKHTDKAGRASYAYLKFVDEESTLQTAMMADAADEHMGLLRFSDNERHESGRIVAQLERFVTRIEYLFNENGCFESGYTKFILQLLKKPRVIFIDGEAKTVGGRGRPSNEIKQRCVSRMKNWVFLAKLTVEAEFPDVDKMLTFYVFVLPVDRKKEDAKDDYVMEETDGPRQHQKKLLVKTEERMCLNFFIYDSGFRLF